MSGETELRLERTKLLTADHDIQEGERRVVRQTALLATLTRPGFDTREAERLLELLAETLFHWRRHRELIRHRISDLERRSGSG